MKKAILFIGALSLLCLLTYLGYKVLLILKIEYSHANILNKTVTLHLPKVMDGVTAL